MCIRDRYLSVLMPLLEGKPVSFAGEEFRVNGGVSVPGSSRRSVLVAALGPQMLRVTGALAELFSRRLDDNLTIPLCGAVGAALVLLPAGFPA